MASWLAASLVLLVQFLIHLCYGRTVVFVQEMCHDDGEVYTIESFRRYLKTSGRELLEEDVQFFDREATCSPDFPSRLLEATWSPDVRALIGSTNEDICELISKITTFKNKPFLSWTCPVDSLSRLLPTVEEASSAVFQVLESLKIRSALIVHSESSLWSRLANKLESLMNAQLSSRKLFFTEYSSEKSLNTIKAIKPKVVILCASYDLTKKILQSFDSYSIYPSMVLVLDIFDLFTPPSLIQYKINPQTSKTEKRNSRSWDKDNTLFDLLPTTITMSTHPKLVETTSTKMFSSNVVNNDRERAISRSENPPNIYPIIKTKTFPNSINDSNNTILNYTQIIEDELGNSQTDDKLDDVTVNHDKSLGEMYHRINEVENKLTEKENPVVGRRFINIIENRTNNDLEEAEQITYSIKKDKIKVREKHVTATMTIKPYKTRQKMYNKSVVKDTSTSKEVVKSSDETYFQIRTVKLVEKYVRENFKYKRRKRANNMKSDYHEKLSSRLRNVLLLMTIERENVGTNHSLRNSIYETIYEALNRIYRRSNNSYVFNFLLYDMILESSNVNLLRIQSMRNKWRLVMSIESCLLKNETTKSETYSISLNKSGKLENFDSWLMEKYGSSSWFDCEDDSCRSYVVKMNVLSLSGVIAVSLLVFTLLVGLAFFIRDQLAQRKKYKRSNKVVLLSSDFVFPQVCEGRRVEEGMEAMLCCWLQQFQEFGGPEIEKPDLIKGSVASLKGLGSNINSGNNGTKGPSSNGSIVRSNYIVDTRTRYNGDLVQMKYFANFGSFELKRKANDVLMVMQGLRHENLNPFIGCLCEPSKPALVFEYCSRGSLEDVLIADEIKLDWTFRLSLLTDLVRGMRYLHSTTLRAHGFLTSRNCVVDARWVLKVTDYGLPGFYRAQGVIPPPRAARDLLWTAPELLRGLDNLGVTIPQVTQSGDVYSFAIVMQEVVVRGEPFCMLALSPQEIIEKVKKPPPLIRPSVSKGAAPPEAINIMRQCWTEQPEMRPDFNAVHDLFRKLNQGRKVNFIDTMFQMLEKYSNNLEELIKERTEQLDMEKKKTEQLLARMLPSYVAEKLKLGMPVDPEEFTEVSIYFSDIVGFTSISAHSSPFQVVDLLNDLYTCFDATINAYNVYKVETIGDAYMVVGGLPVRIPDHAEQIATMALDLLHQAGRFRIRHLPKTPLRLRIGLHTGPCCAGVVGLTMPRYCLFGDTVNTASRMESTGAAWRIHLSQATRDKLEAAEGYTIEYRGLTEIKGKGKLHTYWLLGKAGFEKPLPTPPPIGLDESLLVEKDTLSVSGSSHQKSEDNASDSSVRSSPKPPGALSPKVIHSLSAEEKTMPFIDSDRNSERVNSDKSINLEKSPLYLKKHSTKDTQVTAQQIVEMRKMNFALKQEVSLKQNDTYQRKVDPASQYTGGECSVEIAESCSNGDIKNETTHSPSEDDRLVNEAAKLLLSAKPNDNIRDHLRIRRNSNVEENDLSSPYNHYKLLSPSDSNLNQSCRSSSFNLERPGTGRLLKRQFSLDRSDDNTHGRLYKQNSAGTANDLEKIEEIPTRRLSRMEPCGSTSVSAESLQNSRICSDNGR